MPRKAKKAARAAPPPAALPAPDPLRKCRILALPRELLMHVVCLLAESTIGLLAVLPLRLTCTDLHSACSHSSVWRILGDQFFISFPHVRPTPLFPRLGVRESIHWFSRLLQALSVRFLDRCDGSDEWIRGHIVVPEFGTINDDDFELATVLPGALQVSMEEPREHRAEILVPRGVEHMSVAIEMPYCNDFTHFIYLRRGTEGSACYWKAKRGIHHVIIARDNCSVKREPLRRDGLHLAPEARYREEEESAAEYDCELTPDSRMAEVDPEWQPGRVPGGDGHLFIGITLFHVAETEGSVTTASIKSVQVIG